MPETVGTFLAQASKENAGYRGNFDPRKNRPGGRFS